MSETTHTPGPWEACDRWVSEANDPGHNVGICFTEKRSEALANARLIAAAPDMLAALKVHQLWEKREKEGPLYPFGMSRDREGGEAVWRAWWNDQLNLCREAWELTDVAIAKAEGRP